MNRPGAMGERSLALFLLGLVLFSPPLLSLFNSERFVGGVPQLYLYLFCAWALVIALIGVTAIRSRRSRPGAQVAAPDRRPAGER